jgi:hypothetical protein
VVAAVVVGTIVGSLVGGDRTSREADDAGDAPRRSRLCRTRSRKDSDSGWLRQAQEHFHNQPFDHRRCHLLPDSSFIRGSAQSPLDLSLFRHRSASGRWVSWRTHSGSRPVHLHV